MPQDSTNHTTVVNPSEGDSRIQCQHCGGYFRNQRGVNIHISRSHPLLHRAKLSNKYQTGTCPQNEGSSIHNGLERLASSSQKDITHNTTLEPLQQYKADLSEWQKKFSQPLDDQLFDLYVQNFSSFLRTSINSLPGPKHPAAKYYEARKRNRDITRKTHHKTSSNPERAKKRDRDKRRTKYNYELTQYLFYNQRRKAVRKVLETKNVSCLVDTNEIFNYFTQGFSTKNTAVREHYPSKLLDIDRAVLDDTYNSNITKEEIITATNKIAIDTAPGPDGVLVRALKDDLVSDIISKIATRMLSTGKVPDCFKNARTVLIYKGGDTNQLSNWRPITICSTIRRIIERVLDFRLRQHITFNEHQRGFTNVPGTFLNTSILEAALNSAKMKQNDVTIIFLDIRKAFDNVGHSHLENTLRSEEIPSQLRTLILNLHSCNSTQVETSRGKTKRIPLLRGVMQGSPLSPTLYNLATNHILDELTDERLSQYYGKILSPDLPPLTALGFADDLAIIGKNKEAAIELVQIAIQRFQEIGLEINPSKCIGICLKNGNLHEELLTIDQDCKIATIKHGESIKYLGVSFTDSLSFDANKTITNLRKKLDLLASTPLLRSEQKFLILNTSICSSLIYPFQTANFKHIPNGFLNDCDKMIRSALKEILQLPIDIPDHMLYSDMKYKGLGLFKAGWEAYLQHINTCRLLLQSFNPYVQLTRNLCLESNDCLNILQIPESTEGIKNPRTGFYDARRIRKILREREVTSWSNLPQKGLGVTLYQEHPQANSWVRTRLGLTSSEWREALKMTANVSAVRSLPGRTQDNHLCRRCYRETETLAHVLGSCPYGELLRNTRHHKIRTMIAQELRSSNFQVHEEVHGLASTGSTRRIDMIAIPMNSNKGFIIDPTIRFEKHKNQPEEVHAEKKRIYDPTIPYFKDKYQLQDIEVIGLMVGARGTIPQHFITTWKKFGLKTNTIKDIVITALRGSLFLLRHHLYDN